MYLLFVSKVCSLFRVSWVNDSRLPHYSSNNINKTNTIAKIIIKQKYTEVDNLKKTWRKNKAEFKEYYLF